MWSDGDRERQRKRERKREEGKEEGRLIDAALGLSCVIVEVLSRVLIIQLIPQNNSPSWNTNSF
jgi:hypothetical protein